MGLTANSSGGSSIKPGHGHHGVRGHGHGSHHVHGRLESLWKMYSQTPPLWKISDSTTQPIADRLMVSFGLVFCQVSTTHTVCSRISSYLLPDCTGLGTQLHYCVELVKLQRSVSQQLWVTLVQCLHLLNCILICNLIASACTIYSEHLGIEFCWKALFVQAVITNTNG